MSIPAATRVLFATLLVVVGYLVWFTVVIGLGRGAAMVRG